MGSRIIGLPTVVKREQHFMVKKKVGLLIISPDLCNSTRIEIIYYQRWAIRDRIVVWICFEGDVDYNFLF